MSPGSALSLRGPQPRPVGKGVYDHGTSTHPDSQKGVEGAGKESLGEWQRTGKGGTPPPDKGLLGAAAGGPQAFSHTVLWPPAPTQLPGNSEPFPAWHGLRQHIVAEAPDWNSPSPQKKPCDARYPSILHPRNLRQVGQWIRTPPPLHPSYYPRGNPSCCWSFTQGDAGPHLPAARPTLSPPGGLPVPPPGHHLPPSTGFQSRHFLHTNPARPASESAPRLLQSVHQPHSIRLCRGARPGPGSCSVIIRESSRSNFTRPHAPPAHF